MLTLLDKTTERERKTGSEAQASKISAVNKRNVQNVRFCVHLNVIKIIFGKTSKTESFVDQVSLKIFRYSTITISALLIQ